MDVAELLTDLFGRIRPVAERAVVGLDPDQLTARPAPDANTIAWQVWHLARVQDSHLAELVEGSTQIYVDDDWGPRFGLSSDADDTGYGHSSAEVAAVRPESADALVEYLAQVSEATDRYIAALGPDDLDRVVDRRWDPPVTLGVRLVSVADDCLQHAGQANYARGVLGF
jgi:hypothetical protein